MADTSIQAVAHFAGTPPDLRSLTVIGLRVRVLRFRISASGLKATSGGGDP